MDYEVARIFRNHLIPNAVLWFTGEAVSEDEDDEDEDDEAREEAALTLALGHAWSKKNVSTTRATTSILSRYIPTRRFGIQSGDLWWGTWRMARQDKKPI